MQNNYHSYRIPEIKITGSIDSNIEMQPQSSKPINDTQTNDLELDYEYI